MKRIINGHEIASKPMKELEKAELPDFPDIEKNPSQITSDDIMLKGAKDQPKIGRG